MLLSSIATRRGKGRALLLISADPELVRWNERGGGWASDFGVAVVTNTGYALSDRESDALLAIAGGDGFE